MTRIRSHARFDIVGRTLGSDEVRSRPETPSLGIFDRTLFADGLKAQKGMVTTGPALRWILWILLELTGFVLLDLETIAGLAFFFL